MYKVDEFIKYMMPLDADYSYGVILELKKGRAVVLSKSYPHGTITEVPYRFMDHCGKEVRTVGSREGKNNQ